MITKERSSNPTKTTARSAKKAVSKPATKGSAKKAAPQFVRKAAHKPAAKAAPTRVVGLPSHGFKAPHVEIFEMSAESLLGGKRVLGSVPGNDMDWVGIIRRGISANALDSLIEKLHITQSEFAASVGIPERTLVRRKKQDSLTSEETEKMVRVARVAERAEEVFGKREPALDWLKSPNAALFGVTPLSLLDTEIGAESVMDTLGRIEHGVFA